jgi:hypothetical protein
MGFDERYLRPGGVVTASGWQAFSVLHKGMDAVRLRAANATPTTFTELAKPLIGCV